MKIRQGFVSNSSSSSFVCSVCNESYGGWDEQYDVKYYCCGSHDICGDCDKHIFDAIKELGSDITNAAKVLEISDENVNALIVSNKEDRIELLKEYCIPSYGDIAEEVCPICNFRFISDKTEAEFLREKYGLNKEDVHKEIREKYKNMEDWGNRNK